VVLNRPEQETEAEAFKRMVQERLLDEQELEEAVPSALSGVSSVINSRANSRAASRAASRANSVVGTSGATTPRRDLFSGVTSMKEVFDISYAVHRMTEEKQRRKSLRSLEDPDMDRHALFMHEINGDTSSDEEDLMIDETSSSSQTDEDVVESLSAMHLEHKTKKSGLFELKMENATLLGRRRVPSATQPIDEPVKKFVSATQPIESAPVFYQKTSKSRPKEIPKEEQMFESSYPVVDAPIETTYNQHPLDPPRKYVSATQPIDG
jgi:hypothetical protein